MPVRLRQEYLTVEIFLKVTEAWVWGDYVLVWDILCVVALIGHSVDEVGYPWM